MIAIVYPQFYGIGGIARYLDSYLENLPPEQPPVLLITGDEGMTQRTYPGAEIIHVPLTSSRLSLVIWGWKVRTLLLKLFVSGRIKVVNFHFPPLIPGLFLPTQIPMVLTAHTTYLGMSGNFYSERHFVSPWKKSSLWVKSWMERRIFRMAKAVITLTEQGRQEVLRYRYAGLISEIPNGVDLARFEPDRSNVEKDIDVLFMGRIEIRKGSRPMVDFCKRFIASNPNARICIVGYGDDDAYVHEQLRPLAANVQLTGKLPFQLVRGFYSRSKVYVSTSYYEGLPGTCLEALAMEVPAVVWDFLFYRGLVNPGDTGFVVPVNDLDAMVERVQWLCANPEQALHFGERGRVLLSERYDWSQLATKITNCLVLQAAQ